MNFLRITDITMHNGLLMITATDTDFATITKTFSLTELHAIQQKKEKTSVSYLTLKHLTYA